MSEGEKIGKNLFEYNGIIYTDNIPKNMFISITKEQYIEYMQQKETIEQQQKEIEELKEKLKNCDEHYSRVVKFKNHECITKDKIRELIKEKTKTDTYNFKTVSVKDIEGLLEE